MTERVALVVEDDAAIRRGLVDALRFSGFVVRECGHGDEAIDLAVEHDVDLVLLDVLLPGIDGFEILARLRRFRPRLPVIMLTARGAEDDRVRGLRLGADDYVVKPFSARELLARVDAVLRRCAERPSEVRALVLGDRRVDFDRMRIELPGGETRTLSEHQAEILHYLASNRGRAVGRDELLQHLWGCDPKRVESRTVDMHIARLRDKLEADARAPKLILTVRAKGYRLATEAEVTGHPGSLRVDVRDHGPGVASERARAIFEPFERGGRDAADPVPGVGLGLALARDLARALGGELSHAQPEGAGACFRLRVPAGRTG